VHTTAILVAAGPGTRLGGERPKGFVTLAGVPLFVHSLRVLLSVDAIGTAVVVVPPGCTAEAGSILQRFGPWRCLPALAEGGAERQDSVRAGIRLATGADLLAIHDAARPFVSARVVAEVVGVAARSGAAIAAVRPTDTVKRVDAGGRIAETLDRRGLWLAQTPQVFRAELLRHAHERAAEENITATDDAALVERLGSPVQVVEGDAGNRKITTPDDLAWAEWILSPAREPR
jgi:2-C-methyl-D-erythritol 4-phosphate cytidylyltransferase